VPAGGIDGDLERSRGTKVPTPSRRIAGSADDGARPDRRRAN